jgi:DNA-binding protein HU-beta
MNNKDFIAELSNICGLSADESQKLVNTLLEVLENLWQNNSSVSVSGFGVLEVRKKLERISVNPNTGKKMLIPPKLVLTYKPSALLKEKIK